jgi:AhpD family alkylhydroperoxidase
MMGARFSSSSHICSDIEHSAFGNQHSAPGTFCNQQITLNVCSYLLAENLARSTRAATIKIPGTNRHALHPNLYELIEQEDFMEARFNYVKAAPGLFKAMLDLGHYLQQSGLEEGLLNLVNLRASQINGCAYCLDMHWKDLRAAGENEQRLYSLDAWRESPYYTDRERAALEWTEAVTKITEGHVPDEVYERVRRHFNEKELSDLTLAVVAINGWNRLNIAARTVPGEYKPGQFRTAKRA